MMGGGFRGCTINIIKKRAKETFSTEGSIAYKEKFDKECSIYNVQLSDGTHVVT
jgi:galactokinase